jgi:hypothetical protein
MQQKIVWTLYGGVFFACLNTVLIGNRELLLVKGVWQIFLVLALKV